MSNLSSENLSLGGIFRSSKVSYAAIPSEISQPASVNESNFSDSDYRDPYWAVAYLFHLFIYFLYSGFCIYDFFIRLSHSPDFSPRSGDFHFDRPILFLFLALVAVATSLSFAFLAIFRVYAGSLIWSTLALGVISPAILSLFSFYQGAGSIGLIFFLMATISLFYAYSVRDRVPFSAALLSSASQALEIYRRSLFLAFFGIFFQTIWAAYWILSSVAIFVRWNSNQNSKDLTAIGDTDPGPLFSWLMFVNLVSFYWTSQVIKNIVHVSSSGVAATWYFLYPRQSPPNPVWNSLRRACTWSLGSIAFGSLIVALIRAVRSVLRSLIKKDSRRENIQPFALCLLYIGDCLLQVLDSIAEFFNHFAFAGIGIWGRDFRTAATETWSLIKVRGFDIVINENLTGSVLAMAGLVGGLICGAAGVLLAAIFESGVSDQILFVWGLFGFLIGFALVSISLEVVESSVTTLFICLAADPQALSATKPEIYLQLVPALDARYHSQIRWNSNENLI